MSAKKLADARTLMVLGLLQSGPLHGYELHRIVVAHGTLYADFKKPTLYHLLHRLTVQGVVRVHSEAGTRGRRGERLVFAITPNGSGLFQQLLRQALSTYDRTETAFAIATAYLPWIPAREAQSLLKKRRRAIESLHADVVNDLDHLAAQPATRIRAARSLATDHALSLLQAELDWLDRAMRHLATPVGRTTLLQRPGIAPYRATVNPTTSLPRS